MGTLFENCFSALTQKLDTNIAMANGGAVLLLGHKDQRSRSHENCLKIVSIL